LSPESFSRERLRLLVIADAAIGGPSLVEKIRAALHAGAPAVQLRGKTLNGREMVALGRVLRVETAARDALLFLNDRVDVALVVGADGVHVGDDDLPIEAVRAITPPGFLVGRSVDSASEAIAAEQAGADYVGLGPIFATVSKPGLPAPLGTEGIRPVADSVEIPIVAIGGLSPDNAAEAVACGACGVSVIGSILQAQDPGEATRRLLQAVDDGRTRSARGASVRHT
jgi:thiamine-phosphate pyrophosphorylase